MIWDTYVMSYCSKTLRDLPRMRQDLAESLAIYTASEAIQRNPPRTKYTHFALTSIVVQPCFQIKLATFTDYSQIDLIRVLHITYWSFITLKHLERTILDKGTHCNSYNNIKPRRSTQVANLTLSLNILGKPVQQVLMGLLSRLHSYFIFILVPSCPPMYDFWKYLNIEIHLKRIKHYLITIKWKN